MDNSAEDGWNTVGGAQKRESTRGWRGRGRGGRGGARTPGRDGAEGGVKPDPQRWRVEAVAIRDEQRAAGMELPHAGWYFNRINSPAREWGS